MTAMLEKLGLVGVVPVVKMNRSEDAVALGEALLAGGLPCAEITFPHSGSGGCHSTDCITLAGDPRGSGDCTIRRPG